VFSIFWVGIMKLCKRGSRILLYECLGFVLIILFSWFNELSDLPRFLVGGGPHPRDFRDSIVETLLVLLVWLLVIRLTGRLLARLHYLEGLLRVCAWCRKIGHNERWVNIEDYFEQGFQIGTTHGMCPDCLKKVEEDTAEFFKKEREGDVLPPQAEAA